MTSMVRAHTKYARLLKAGERIVDYDDGQIIRTVTEDATVLPNGQVYVRVSGHGLNTGRGGLYFGHDARVELR